MSTVDCDICKGTGRIVADDIIFQEIPIEYGGLEANDLMDWMRKMWASMGAAP